VLRLPARDLSPAATAALGQLQSEVDAGADFSAQAALAKAWWNRKSSRAEHKRAFLEIRDTLAAMAYGSVRCAYCEDSAADEIEHIAAKTVVPSRAFDWSNYCFACGPCNAPKGNQHATVDAGGNLTELDPDTLVAAPIGQSALIDPRLDQPGSFLELDIGGVTPSGAFIPPTSQFMVRVGLTAGDNARAEWTIRVLRLNREIVRKARETAIQAYRASLLEYADEKDAGAPQQDLDQLRDGILAMPHPTVLNELIRQAGTQPKVRSAIARASEIAGWIR
jgi:uncharacterized protein (TIGR02646 family)